MAGDARRLVEHRPQPLVDLLDGGELRLAVLEPLRISAAQTGQRIAEIGKRGGGKSDGSKATSLAECGQGGPPASSSGTFSRQGPSRGHSRGRSTSARLHMFDLQIIIECTFARIHFCKSSGSANLHMFKFADALMIANLH